MCSTVESQNKELKSRDMPNFLLGQRNLAIGHAADAFAKRKEER